MRHWLHCLSVSAPQILGVAMSIRLSLLLEGAYALHEGRKRRVEWETNAERNCVQKVSPASETFSEAQPRANARACSDDETCDDQDMAFLHGALRSRGPTTAR